MEQVAARALRLAEHAWHRAVSPATMRLLGPLCAVALVWLAYRYWRWAEATALRRAGRWWLAAVTAATVVGCGVYVLSAAPADPSGFAQWRANPGQPGRVLVLAPAAAGATVLIVILALVAAWRWRLRRLDPTEVMEIERSMRAWRQRTLRPIVAAAGIVLATLVAACVVASVGAPQVPAMERLRLANAGASGATLWVGTAAGVSLLPASESSAAWRTPLRPWGALPATRVYDIVAGPAGDVWLATDSGVARGSRHGTSADGARQWEWDSTVNAALPNRRALGADIDSRGTLWVATEGGGAALSPAQGARAFTNRNAPLLHQILDSVLVDRDGRIWFGGAGGVNVYQPSVGGIDGDWLVGFTRYTSNEMLPADLVFTIVEDTAGRIWFGTLGGASVFAPEPSRFGLGAYDLDRWRTFSPRNSPLPDAKVHAILEDRQGRIWLGTEGGIAVLDGRNPGDTTRWTRFTATDSPSGTAVALPHPWVEALAEGPDGRIWAGTRGGLAVYDPAAPELGWTSFHASRLRRWLGYLWPPFWQRNIIADDVTALAWVAGE
jgi:hypothetical protein